jgi:ABC-type Mn2+/Zn2+ transport system permease subunit
LLGVFFSSSVALGVILVQLTPGYQSDLISFLFGNILAVNQTDVYLTLLISATALLTILFAGKSFIAIIFDPDLARAEGIRVDAHELLFLLLLAGIVALAIKLVGIVLVTALLIIPAATAHNLTRSLSTLFIGSISISLTSIILGMLLSVVFNSASGPTIVLTGSAFFALSLLLRPLIKSS